MIELRPLTLLTETDVQRIATGYLADGKYLVEYVDTEQETTFHLRFVALAQPYHKIYDHFDEETLAHYGQVLKEGYSFGAFAADQLVGFLISGVQQWNHSLWVWEFHVAPTHRRLGIGRELMETAAAQARQANLRVIVCETQTTNIPAIQAYRKLGFRLEGIALSYYSNQDYPDGEVAVFMKRRLD
ncbi:MAG: N-acetyltransferase [Caldilineaceae bacterium]